MVTWDGFADAWVSEDGMCLHQLHGLQDTIGVYKVTGSSLELQELVTEGLPPNGLQGLIAFDTPENVGDDEEQTCDATSSASMLQCSMIVMVMAFAVVLM